MTFNDWFHKNEGYSLRSERYYESFDAFTSKEALACSMKLWLESAYNAGRLDATKESVRVAKQYLHKMDAGKEHIIVALEDLL